MPSPDLECSSGWSSTENTPRLKDVTTVREEDLPTPEAKQNYREFWTKMNNDLDQYSVKKWIASELIRMHKARGDQIFFVTKRINTGSERLTELLKKEFDLPNLEPVIFTNRGSKTPAFKRVRPS